MTIALAEYLQGRFLPLNRAHFKPLIYGHFHPFLTRGAAVHISRQTGEFNQGVRPVACTAEGRSRSSLWLVLAQAMSVPHP